jgi:hypothetical protein
MRREVRPGNVGIACRPYVLSVPAWRGVFRGSGVRPLLLLHLVASDLGESPGF